MICLIIDTNHDEQQGAFVTDAAWMRKKQR
jgi:hypothetical protein